MKSRLKDTLLLIGSGESDRARLHDIFEARYYLLEAETAEQGIMLLKQNSECIAAVLADIPLAREEDVRALVAASNPETTDEIPVILFIVPSGTGSNEEYAFVLGAADVVLKPYTNLSVQRRVQVLVDLYSHRWHLEKLVEDQSDTIRKANQTVLDTLSAVIEHRSTESGNHVLRIRRLTRILLQEVALCCPEYRLDETGIDTISSAAALHDIGKISIPDSILNKPGKLSPQEVEVMRTHTTVGSRLVEHLEGLGDIMYLRYAYNICLYHHERWDGGGYPKGLSGDDIPICAQVVGIADAFDALTTDRVYKPAYGYDVAVNMILNGECGVFSPKLLECFKHVKQELIDLARQYADGYSPKSDQIRVPLPDPEYSHHPLTAVQLSQLKYQTLLHHFNDTVIELDVDNRTFHVVHNPNPDFVSILSNASFDEIGLRMMEEGIHPEDVSSTAQLQELFSRKLFRQNQRKCSFRCRMYNPVQDAYHPYEVTLLRVNTENPSQRIVLAIFHDMKDGTNTPSEKMKELLAAPAWYDLMGANLCCGNDEVLTILDGSSTLLHLTGYGIQQIQTQFNNSLINMVLPEDTHILKELAHDPNRYSGKLEREYRIRHRNGNILWIMDRSRVHIDADGTEYCYHVLNDITACKKEQERLAAAFARNQVVIDQTEGVIFEWDLKSDVVTCSKKWQERFGYGLVTPNAAAVLRVGSYFHPDDVATLQEKIRELRQSSHTTFLDVRIVSKEGRYLWSRMRATSVFDEQGAPAYIIGIIHDINELKTDALSLRQQAERDSLTKLLNKASVQQAVTTYLEERESSRLAALMVMDLDNFKVVNDTHGHLYGDAVLTQIGTTLRSLFRSQDAIGRIGGDEFLILLKDVPSREMVEERCALLVNTIRSQLQKLMPDLPVSVSIGCAMVPEHGNSYVDLFRRADEALYLVKRKGKNGYAFFNPQEAYDSLFDAAEHTTRIDSDAQPTMNDDSLVRFVFQSLYESRNLDATIEELLGFIGSRFNVSRVYVFENNEDNTCCSNTYEWCNEDITPEKNNLQNVSYITDIPGWPDVYNEKGLFYCTDISQLMTPFREILEPQGVKSMLHCAIMDCGVFRGYVGFDECKTNRLWTQGQVSLLEFLAQVMAVFLIKKQKDRHNDSEK